MMRTGNSHAGRVNLTKYVKLGGATSEKWRFCPVVRTGNGRIRPDYVLIDGRPELHKEGAYYIEWYLDGRRYRESVGKNPSEAFAVAERKAQVLKNQALGIEIVGEDKQTGATLAEACREFLEETRQLPICHLVPINLKCRNFHLVSFKFIVPAKAFAAPRETQCHDTSRNGNLPVGDWRTSEIR